jgi:VWFA-related protein
MYAALLAVSLLAQTPAPTFRVATRLIQVNVIVHDRKGDPVTGLTKDQFTIYDQGRPQNIAFFSEQTSHSSPASTAARPVNVFSNRPDEKSSAAAGSVTAILFDSLNTDFNDSAFARGRIAKFLHAIRPEDRVALYGLSTGLFVLHDFTQDADQLVRALDRFKATDSIEASVTKFKESNTRDPRMDAMLNDINQRVSDVYMGVRVQNTAAALEAIANHLAGLPGRKNLVWVSGSFPISIGYFQRRMPGTRPQKEGFSKEVEAAARALSNANVAIYPVAAQRLMGLPSFALGPGSPPPPRGVIPRPDLPPIADSETMDILAETTGGRVFRDTNDIEGAVRSAIDDSRCTYTLGYYPDHDRWDGKFREIKVQVKRSAVEVRYRRGYMAFPEAPPDPNRLPLQVADVIAAPLASSELGLTMQVELLGARQLRTHLRVDTGAMRFEQKDGRWIDQLEVLWVQLGADGGVIVSSGETLNFHFSPETYRTAAEDGVRMSATEAIDSQAVELRFTARDRGTGAVGSLNIPLRSLFDK